MIHLPDTMDKPARTAINWTGVRFGELECIRPSRAGGGFWVMRCASGHDEIRRARDTASAVRAGKRVLCATCKALAKRSSP